MAPHTGQSSQLFIDYNHRSAQFLPAVARSALNLPVTPSRELTGELVLPVNRQV